MLSTRTTRRGSAATWAGPFVAATFISLLWGCQDRDDTRGGSNDQRNPLSSETGDRADTTAAVCDSAHCADCPGMGSMHDGMHDGGGMHDWSGMHDSLSCSGIHGVDSSGNGDDGTGGSGGGDDGGVPPGGSGGGHDGHH